MLPILISLGPVKIYSFGVCLVIGLFLGLYWWWKMGRDEHFEEIALFDGFFLSLITFFVVGRVGYVLTHMADLGTWYRSLAFLTYPGLSGAAGIVASGIFMILFARAQGWQVWKVADAYVLVLAVILSFSGLGSLLNGSNPIWQVNAWLMVWAILTFGVVARVRKNFRFYTWYKGEASMAQEGLASLIFVVGVGIYYLVTGIYRQAGWQVGILVIIMGSILIYKRVGRREAGLWSKLMGVIRRK